ncbi:hypothetical protein D3C77_653370 [compost metagenome]
MPLVVLAHIIFATKQGQDVDLGTDQISLIGNRILVRRSKAGAEVETRIRLEVLHQSLQRRLMDIANSVLRQQPSRGDSK